MMLPRLVAEKIGFYLYHWKHVKLMKEMRYRITDDPYGGVRVYDDKCRRVGFYDRYDCHVCGNSVILHKHYMYRNTNRLNIYKSSIYGFVKAKKYYPEEKQKYKHVTVGVLPDNY